MRAKRLWATWAYLGLVGVIALEVFFITFMVLYIVPRFQRLLGDGLVDAAIMEEHRITWMPRFLNGVQDVAGGYTTYLVLGVAVLWGLFEWRVRSEHKPFMRLSALGTAAVGLMVVIVLAAGAMVACFTLAMPAMARIARPYAQEQIAAIDRSAGALDQVLARADWRLLQEHVDQASHALGRLTSGPALASLTSRNDPTTVEELRAHVKAAHEMLQAAQQGIAAKDVGRVNAALAAFRKVFAPVRDAANRPAR